MGNSILTNSEITYEAARILKNNLVFADKVNRSYDDQFAVTGAKIGNTLNIRKPARYVGRTGPTISVEGQTETFVPLTLNTQFGVDLQFNSQDRTLSLDNFGQRVLKPAVATIANKIDRDGLALFSQVANSVGTPGTTPANLTPYLSAGALLDFMAAPRDDLRSVVMDPNAQATLVGTLTTLFNPNSEISKQYKNGQMGWAIGNQFAMDQNINSQTVGPLGGSPTVDGTVGTLTGSALSTKGWTSSAASRLNVGDVFTIGSVYSVNPQSRQSTGQLQQFVVTAAFSSNSSGKGNISIYPAITVSGQFQTVNSTPVDGAAITVVGAANTVSPQNMLFHRDAFILGMADLRLPGKGVVEASRVSDDDLGISIRYIESYDAVNDLFISRFDVLYGWACLYPELACRIQG